MAMYFASKAFVRSLSEGRGPRIARHGRDGDLRMSRSDHDRLSEGCEYEWPQLLHHDKPATARQLATYAYRRMMRGSTLAYHGPLTKAGALAGTGSSPRSDPANRRVHERRQAAHA
ncbi:MAG: hypothetical protein R2683_03945 [Bifidobacterium adolescentis]